MTDIAVEAQDDAATPRSIFSAPVRSSTVGILIVITLIAFEAMAVSAALPTAARDLHGLSAYGWAFSGFLIASVLGMVVSGQMCDADGPRLPVAAGLVGFVGGLMISGSATVMAQLVVGRLVQGFGSGLLITAIYVVIGERYPGSLQPKVFAATSSAWVVPSLVGPLISGTLAQHASWRWVFLGLVPFAIIGAGLLVPVLRAMPRRGGTAEPRRGGTAESRRGGRLGSMWRGGRIVRAGAVAAGVAALEQVGQHPSLLSVPVAAVGLGLLGWGLVALLPPGTLVARPGVAAPVALRGLLAGAFFGTEASVPLSLTLQHGYGAIEAGLPLACAGMSWGVGSWWQGRDVDRDENRRRQILVRVGFTCVAIGTVLAAVSVQPGTSGLIMYPAWLVAGLGAGLSMSSFSVLLLRNTTDERRGADSAALQLSDSTCAAITTGVAGVVVAAAARSALSYTVAFTVLDLLMCGVAVVGVLAARRVRRPT